jgi:AcrR family transcriptional regulator
MATRAEERREHRGSDTRQRIVEAAWRVIAERGLAGLTTRRVARAAGVSHGMCHYYFETKDEMVLAVVDHARRYWIDPLEALVDGPAPPGEAIDEVIRWMAEPATREVMRVHLQLMAYSEYDERLRNRMSQEYARWHRGYVRLFGALVREGVMAPDVDAETLGIGFATLADGLVDQQSLDASLEPEGVMRAFLSPFLVDGKAARRLR